MLIKIDGYLRVATLEHSLSWSKTRLRSAYHQFIQHHRPEAFAEELCEVFGFQYADADWGARFDLVLDTDTDRWYRPRYAKARSGGDIAKKRQEWDPWFFELQGKQISEYSDDDLRRCLQERINFEAVLPEAVRVLCHRPEAGCLFRGELLVVMIFLEPAIWRDREDLLNTVLEVCSKDLSFLKKAERDRVEEWKEKMRQGLTPS